jgi:nucleotide-binding universal stress UspA family protein
MFQRILVPLDGSLRGEQALPVAARLARAFDGSLVLLRVAYPPVVYEGYMPELSPFPQPTLEAELEKVTDYLEGIAHSDNLAGTKTEIKVLVGPTAPTILSFAQSFPADMIVMSSHGYTGVKRWALGSVADKLVRHAPVPVLVLREEGPAPSIPQPGMGHPLRTLVTLDGSSLSETVLEPVAYLVAALAAPEQGTIQLMRVVDLPSTHGKLRSQAHIYIGVIEQARQEAEAYLRLTANKLHQGTLADLHLAITMSVVNDPDVAGAIIQMAEGDTEAQGTTAIQGCDLIAMATHGRGGLQRWAAGSVTERVLHATKLPLLVVRPQARELRRESTGNETTGSEVLEAEATMQS